MDREEFYKTFKEIRDELTKDQYRKFYYAYRKWEQANYSDWWKNYKWREGVKEAVCKIKPSSMRCQPADEAGIASFFNAANTANVFSFYGPDWATQIDAICAAEKPMTCSMT